MATATIYIGRFSPFHLGHAHVLKTALSSSDLVIVLIGSAGQARNLKNPFTYTERMGMILAWIGTEPVLDSIITKSTIKFAPLMDQPYNDALWISSVQKQVQNIIDETGLDVTEINITGSDRDSSTWYLSAFPQWKQALIDEHRVDGTGSFNATQVRDILFSNPPFTRFTENLKSMVPDTTYLFLERFIGTPEHTRLTKWYKHNRAYKDAWSVAPYPPTFITTDAIVIQSGHVLVVERGAEPGEGLWALPGGFVEQDERLQDGVVRELIEETGISLAEGKKQKELTRSILLGSIKGKEIFDHPNRSDRGRTITVAYLFRLDDTKPLPKVKGQHAPLHDTNGVKEVETAKAFWLPINDALNRTDMWFEDHHAVLTYFIAISGDR